MTTAELPALNWDAFEAALAQTMDSYESRSNQQNLAHAVEAAMHDYEHLVAQAGTGTGKSFAGVVPAIAQALSTGSSVVLATGTKVLQGQYVLKDLPRLVELIEKYFGRRITFAELKGRGNYLCMAKVAEGPDVPALKDILAEIEADPTHTGDMERFSVEIEGRDMPKLTSSSEECPGASHCPFAAQCFAVAASNKAKTANLVITNHAMLAIDAVISRPAEEGAAPSHAILPQYRHLIVDEAHELPGYVTNALGAQMTDRTFINLIGEAQNFTSGAVDGTDTLAAVTQLFEGVSRLVPPRGDSSARLDERALEPIRRQIAEITADLHHFRQEVGLVDTAGDEASQGHKNRLKSKLDALINKVTILDPWNEDSAEADTLIGEVVRWVEREKDFRGNDRIKIGYSPLSVGNFLHTRLWSHHQATLLSATLPGKNLSYIPTILGMRDYRVFDAGTPFDYPQQARLFVPDEPSMNPKKDPGGHQAGAIRYMDKLVRAAGGRALLLFTSRKAMEAAYRALAEDFEEDGFPCYKQGPGMSTDALMRIKADEPESVVFGLKSLMQGVSVEGEALQLVILDKMPFPVPSEIVYKARSEAMDRKAAARAHVPMDKAAFEFDGSFYGMSIPEMMLVLQQALGRLIRTKSDQGVMAVLDSRLSPRTGLGYGKKAVRSLPPARNLSTDRETVAYLKGLHP